MKTKEQMAEMSLKESYPYGYFSSEGKAYLFGYHKGHAARDVEVSSLTDQYADTKVQAEEYIEKQGEQIQALVVQRDSLKEQLRVATEALEFYANPEMWIDRNKTGWKRTSTKSKGDYEMIADYKHPNTDWIGSVGVGGRRAREALSHLQGPEKAGGGE